jgi:hypothetical protein
MVNIRLIALNHLQVYCVYRIYIYSGDLRPVLSRLAESAANRNTRRTAKISQHNGPPIETVWKMHETKGEDN